MIEIREAKGSDAQAISDIFRACYGTDYAYPDFYDLDVLAKLIYTDDAVLLVAEEKSSGKLLGTASVICQIGANSDLTGEFGRLAVHPDARNLGIGKLLMQGRLERIRDRLEVALMDARVVHPYTLKIAESSGFHPVGFLPLKMLLATRESISLCVQYFGQALSLRNNHPRIIPEVYTLACASLEHCGLRPDVVVDEKSAAYPESRAYEIEELSTQGYSSLLRIERGRIANREIFGPVRLHYGFFKLKARQSQYLIARENGQIAGAVGFTLDRAERAVRIFELIALDDEVIRFLLSEVVRLSGQEWEVDYLELDVSAYAPRMQRTLIELGFTPAAYIPALVFHHVERLDAIKMVKLNVPADLGDIYLSDRAERLRQIVMKSFQSKEVVPQVASAVNSLALFTGLNDEQVNRLARLCHLEDFDEGEVIFEAGQEADRMYVILHGSVEVLSEGRKLGMVAYGDCLGEVALLNGEKHSATARTSKSSIMAVLTRNDLIELIRLRPDIGVLIYKNLAIGLGKKLKGSVELRSE